MKILHTSLRTLRTIKASKISGMDFKKIITEVKKIAPPSLAESWDNVGVLVEPPNMKNVSKILLTNDLTLDVMQEAITKNAQMILSYHPPIFRPLKSVTAGHWKERIIGQCLASKIAVYSPHTSLDSVQGGINDWLISAFGKGEVAPVQSSESNPKWDHKVEIICHEVQNQNEIYNQLTQEFSKSLIRNCEAKQTITIYSCEGTLTNIVSFMVSLEPKAHLAISKLEKVPVTSNGIGRKISLGRPMTLSQAVEVVKGHLNLNHVRVAVKHGGSVKNPIYSVAVCAGSGISVLRGVKVDLALTGEMSHHDVLEMTQRGTNVILTEHSNCERGYLSAVLQEKLKHTLHPKVEVLVSEVDKDPLEII